MVLFHVFFFTCILTLIFPVDLVYGVTLSQVTHDSKIDWLELNETGHRLLFRDKKMRLTLLDIRSDTRTLILSYCTFVQVTYASILHIL